MSRPDYEYDYEVSSGAVIVFLFVAFCAFAIGAVVVGLVWWLT